MKDLTIEIVLSITDILSNSQNKWNRISFGAFFVQYESKQELCDFQIIIHSDMSFSFNFKSKTCKNVVTVNMENFSYTKLRVLENDETLFKYINY